MAKPTIKKPAKVAKEATVKSDKKVLKPSTAKTSSDKTPKPKTTASASAKKTDPQPKLLSSTNPQISKGYGDAPVQEYIAAMPGWKHEVGVKLDELIVKNVPKVYKCVKWNSPFYGFEDEGWFLSIYCYTKYVTVGFFRGLSLKPIPDGESKHKDVRYLK
ncbi:MAG: DUF1801 domain-containing protein, partial [Proteobacteria bacterium]